MKVLNLRCANGHRFEGWFASDDDLQSQNDRGLIECPLCADKAITRLPSAPRLNLSGAREPPAGGRAEGEPTPADRVTMQAAWLRAVRHVMANTEDVGERFAEEARRIHYGEADERGIRGRATPRRARGAARRGHRGDVAAGAGGAEGAGAVARTATGAAAFETSRGPRLHPAYSTRPGFSRLCGSSAALDRAHHRQRHRRLVLRPARRPSARRCRARPRSSRRTSSTAS